MLILTDIEEGELGIDLGLDGGITEDSMRPPYYIANIAQLTHYQKNEISISKTSNISWAFEEIKKSIHRLTTEETYLQETPNVHLDWKFS